MTRNMLLFLSLILVALCCALPTTAADGEGADDKKPPRKPPVRRDPTEADPELKRALRKDATQPGPHKVPSPVRIAPLPPLPTFALKGRMIAGTRRLAMIAIGDRQYLLAPGDTIGVSVGSTTLKLSVRTLDATQVRVHVLPHKVEVVIR